MKLASAGTAAQSKANGMSAEKVAAPAGAQQSLPLQSLLYGAKRP
jgi:hypothetical protein